MICYIFVWERLLTYYNVEIIKFWILLPIYERRKMFVRASSDFMVDREFAARIYYLGVADYTEIEMGFFPFFLLILS